jgi:DNA-binding PadR family transcriptional regulator
MSEATHAGDAPEPTPDATDLTDFQKRILFILAEDSRYGLAVKRDLEDYYGTEIHHGRLYPNLDDLIDEGYVEKNELDKRTNQYALTNYGERAVEALLQWALDKWVQSDADAEATHVLVDQANSNGGDGR